MKKISVLVATVSLAALAGCQTPPYQGGGQANQHEFNCIAGTVGGAVIGGVLGSTIGGGLGNTLATAAGAGAGAYAGQALGCK